MTLPLLSAGEGDSRHDGCQVAGSTGRQMQVARETEGEKLWLPPQGMVDYWSISILEVKMTNVAGVTGYATSMAGAGNNEKKRAPLQELGKDAFLQPW